MELCFFTEEEEDFTLQNVKRKPPITFSLKMHSSIKNCNKHRVIWSNSYERHMSDITLSCN